MLAGQKLRFLTHIRLSFTFCMQRSYCYRDYESYFIADGQGQFGFGIYQIPK